MELKIKVTTPKGASKGFDTKIHMKLIKKIMLKGSKIKEQYISDDGSEIYWLVEVSARNYLSVNRNVSYFGMIVEQFFTNKKVKKLLRKMADTPEDYEQMCDMISNGTQVEIVKTATAEELVEANTTWWQKIKQKFKKEKVKE